MQENTTVKRNRKHKLSVHHSSVNPTWETPPDFFEAVNRGFNFSLDVCASDHNTKCVRYFTEETNGLAQSWQGETCWMNPPYGRVIGNWMKKAAEESAQGNCTVVCLVPARTDTRWWHDYVTQAYKVVFLKRRLHFVGAPAAAPFPSALVIFNQEAREIAKRLVVEHLDPYGE